MKRLILTVILTLIATVTFSQINSKRLAITLNLNEQQTEQMYPIAQTLNRDLAIADEQQEPIKRMREYYKTVRKNLKQTRKILTKEQQQLYARMLLETVRNSLIQK